MRTSRTTSPASGPGCSRCATASSPSPVPLDGPLERLETVPPVVVQPRPDLRDAFRPGPVQAAGARAALGHEIRLLHHPQVLGQRGLRDDEPSGYLTGGEFISP